MEPNSKNFRAAMGRFASGVTVVTSRAHDGRDHGMTASAFSSVSLDPPLILVCIKNENHTLEILEDETSLYHHKFAVNILARKQETLSNRFAGGYIDDNGSWQRWPEDKDKFEDLSIKRGSSGIVLLDGALASLDCTVEHIYDGGDHKIIVGRIHDIILSEETPNALLYFSGKYGDFKI
ncbi:MAG: flavin reductase [Deltaproteobacteria bacterium]|nr:flavin reductase [Deltaproteobacteria bacterium]